MPGTEVKIAEDGEILIKGPGVMQGYHNLPEQTAEVLTPTAGSHTGDIGEIDDEGFLRITDRKKDLIKTSGGKYIAPPAIEGSSRRSARTSRRSIVHGDKRNFVSALVTLDPDAIEEWAVQRPGRRAYAEIVASDGQTTPMVQGYVDELNAGSTAGRRSRSSSSSTATSSVEDGELTPSIKVKRKVVEEKYADELDGALP